MGTAERYGGLLGLWEAQRNPDLVEADQELAALVGRPIEISRHPDLPIEEVGETDG